MVYVCACVSVYPCICVHVQVYMCIYTSMIACSQFQESFSIIMLIENFVMALGKK